MKKINGLIYSHLYMKSGMANDSEVSTLALVIKRDDSMVAYKEITLEELLFTKGEEAITQLFVSTGVCSCSPDQFDKDYKITSIIVEMNEEELEKISGI